MNAMIKVFFISIVLSSTSFATTMKELSSLANDLLSWERSGRRFIPEVKIELNLSNNIKMIKEIPNENIGTKIINIKENFQIKSIKKIEEQVYRVNFSIETHNDSFLMLIHNSPKKITKYGKAEILSAPDNIYIGHETRK